MGLQGVFLPKVVSSLHADTIGGIFLCFFCICAFSSADSCDFSSLIVNLFCYLNKAALGFSTMFLSMTLGLVIIVILAAASLPYPASFSIVGYTKVAAG